MSNKIRMDFIKKIDNNPEAIEFTETMAVIDQLYSFTETAFSNGTLTNKAGENSGSCKLFSFAKMNGLDVEQTLACFGSYYRDDVLKNPDADNHQNIRNFMKSQWEGVIFSAEALVKK